MHGLTSSVKRPKPDATANFCYYRARYYDQSTGRFINEDPLRFSGGMNFFAYVHDNPVALDDPTGLCDNKCKLSISCGPTPRTQGFSHCTVTIQDGNTYTAYDGYPSGSIWLSTLKVAPGRGVPPGPNSFLKNAPVPCDCGQNAANDINSSNMFYNFALQNSNTAAAMIAAKCGANPGTWPPGTWGAFPSPPPGNPQYPTPPRCVGFSCLDNR